MKRALLAMFFLLCGCERPYVAVKDARGQTVYVQAAWSTEYTESMEQGRKSPHASPQWRRVESLSSY